MNLFFFHSNIRSLDLASLGCALKKRCIDKIKHWTYLRCKYGYVFHRRMVTFCLFIQRNRPWNTTPSNIDLKIIAILLYFYSYSDEFWTLNERLIILSVRIQIILAPLPLAAISSFDFNFGELSKTIHRIWRRYNIMVIENNTIGLVTSITNIIWYCN